MLLKACLNGSRRRGEHPALPITSAAIATEAARAVAAGADALHVHPKDDQGVDTLNAAVVAATLEAVRKSVPGVPVGVTTGAWAMPDPSQRVALIRDWTVLPDFASVNWHEPGAQGVAEALFEHGVGVEAGCHGPCAAGPHLTSGTRHNAGMALESRHISVSISRPATEVYEYASNPANLPEWAAGLGSSIQHVDGQWVADSPMGRVVVEYAENNEYGVLDHDVTLPSGETVYNPMRVLADGSDSEVVFTVRRRSGTSDADFARDAHAVTADLAVLKRLLENLR